MPAIVTITFNPCIDVNVSVPALKPEIFYAWRRLLHSRHHASWHHTL